MKLYGSPASPYARKARVLLKEKNLPVDFRYPHDWRSRAPKLARWHAGIAARESFASTLPPGFTPVR